MTYDYVGILIMLFTHFYHKNYVVPAKRKKAEERRVKLEEKEKAALARIPARRRHPLHLRPVRRRPALAVQSVQARILVLLQRGVPEDALESEPQAGVRGGAGGVRHA